MATQWSARVVIGDADRQPELERGVQAALDTVVAEMSQWERNSDLSRFNRAPAGQWQALPSGFAAVIAEALTIAELSDGAFDPTVGKASELWGFGATEVSHVPARDVLTQALAGSGWERLAFDSETSRLRQPGGLALDLSGIAKGFGADRAGETLRNAGAKAFLIDVGGELLGHGVKPDMQPWWVELEMPPGAVLPDLRVALYGLAVATSGDYRRFHELPGGRLSHTLDPTTAAPVENGVASVSVLAKTAMRADALATTLMVLGNQAGAFADRHGIAARIIRRCDGAYIEHITPTLAAMID